MKIKAYCIILNVLCTMESIPTSSLWSRERRYLVSGHILIIQKGSPVLAAMFENEMTEASHFSQRFDGYVKHRI